MAAIGDCRRCESRNGTRLTEVSGADPPRRFARLLVLNSRGAQGGALSSSAVSREWRADVLVPGLSA